MQKFHMARGVLSFFNVCGVVLILIGGYVALNVLSRNFMVAELVSCIVIIAIGMVIMAIAQLGLAQITTAENTGEMLRLMARGNSISGAGADADGDLVEVYRGKRILREGDGVSVDGFYYPNAGLAKGVIDKGGIPS